MGFTCETLVVPNVPIGRDTLVYLTNPPLNRNQEEVQAQARALGIAKLHGVPSSDIESGFFDAAEIAAKPLTLEEKQALQNSKTCFVPSKLAPENMGKLGESPSFAFPAVKQRGNVYQSTSIRHVLTAPRQSSILAPQQAPVLLPSVAEMRNFTAFLETNAELLNKYGMIRVQPPDNEPIPLPVGTTDNLAFKTETQVFVKSSNVTKFTHENLRKGFYKALARFLRSDLMNKKTLKWPTVEGRPLDLYKFYRIVEQRHGPDTILKRKEWVQLTREMGFVRGQSTSLSLRTAYGKYLEPFRQWLASKLASKLASNPSTTATGNSYEYETIVPLDAGPVKPGWSELGLGIIYYTGTDSTNNDSNSSNNGLEVVSTQPSLRTVPPYTLRQFRYKWTRPQVSAEQAELEYANLPECYETERISQSSVTLKMLPTKTNDASSFDISAFPFAGTIAEFCKDGADDLNLFPELDTGARFATTLINPSEISAVRVLLLVDGSARTYYSANTWTDHYQGEFLIIHPKTKVVGFCHGYSASLSVNVLPYKSWMQTYASALSANQQFQAENQICAERCVYESSINARSLSLDQRNCVVSVLEQIRSRDAELVQKLKECVAKHSLKLTIKPNTETRVCKDLKKFFLCVFIANASGHSHHQFLTVDQFLATFDSEKPVLKRGDKVQVYTQYLNLDVAEYFENLIFEVNNAPTAEEAVVEWLKQVSDALTRKQLITESEISALCTSMPPNSAKCECIAMKLGQMKDKLTTFLASKENQANIDLFQSVECADDGGILERVYKSKSSENEEFSSDVKLLEQKYDKGEPITADLDLFFKKHGDMAQFQQFWQNIGIIETWLKNLETASKVVVMQDRGTAFAALREQARQLNLPPCCEAMCELNDFFETQKTKVLNSMMFLYSLQMDDIAALLRLQSVIQSSYVEDADTRTMLTELFASYPVLFRLHEQSLVKRPRRSEVLHLTRYPLIESACADLDAWLIQAKRLDWEAISIQVNHMVWGRALPVMPKPVSVSAIRNTYIALYALKVVPDDVESVEAMFKNTLIGVDSVALELRAHYGFLL